MPRIPKITLAEWNYVYEGRKDEQFDERTRPKIAARRALIAKSRAERYLQQGDIALRQAWEKGSSIALAATLAPFNKRIKRCAVTSIVETIELCAFLIDQAAAKQIVDLAENQQKEAIKIFEQKAKKKLVNDIYSHNAKLAAAQMAKTRTYEHAKQAFTNKVSKLRTDISPHYLSYTHKHILEVLRSTQLPFSEQKFVELSKTCDLGKKNFHCLTPNERANTRRRIARWIDLIPPGELACEIAVSISFLCEKRMLRKIRFDKK
ncbi:protein of unknown function [Pseudodesulfovibrio profundus]|uniref:Uncharacterized protein n=1 Tax=Pseudodesulfovibrio profundus TaxID=57320 RepID=A0A2C8FDL1_9BACT|nr:hypothetical protein [Pseudodesulfovibrio profundus]SOB60513.1 protein of unknown function [Pseudodesulfovibrio profundus]